MTEGVEEARVRWPVPAVAGAEEGEQQSEGTAGPEARGGVLRRAPAPDL
ncbi:MAG: hypothetical protein WA688_10375 [Thermoplasmata archaeon]